MPIDQKPKCAAPEKLQRGLNACENPWVVMVVDYYMETWSWLGWLQLSGDDNDMSS